VRGMKRESYNIAKNENIRGEAGQRQNSGIASESFGIPSLTPQSKGKAIWGPDIIF